MLGPAVIVVVLLIALPIGFVLTGGVVAVLVGAFLHRSSEADHEGSELLDLYV